MARAAKAKGSADLMRAIALKLPEAMEAPHFDFPSFRVNGKIFATARLGEPLVMLKLPTELQQAMVAAHPDVFSLPPGAWAKGGATFAATDKIDRKLLADLTASAWANVAPKKLVEAHAAKLKRK